jgi:signal peptidase I
MTTTYRHLALGAVAIAIGISAALAQTGRFEFPSGSMKPTILPGAIVNVVSYASGAQPARGDLIAFHTSAQPRTVHLMRVVGVGGDKVQVVNGALQLNGEPVKREPIADFADTDDGTPQAVKQWHETLPGGAAYNVIELVPHGPFDNTALMIVPPGHVFVLGDNRENVRDSRDPGVGMIPLANVNGRVAK